MNYEGLLTSQIEIDFDAAAYLTLVDKNAKELMKKAARAWLLAALPRVPVYTGTAVASLKPIGQFVGVAIPSGTMARRTYKGPASGKFEFKTDNFTYSFEISSEVFYFYINEYYDVSEYIHLKSPVPWGAFAAGDAAADKVIADETQNIFPSLAGIVRGK